MPDTTALDMGTNNKFQPSLSATSDAPAVAAPAPTPTPSEGENVANVNSEGVNSPAAAPASSGENTEPPASSDDHGEDAAANAKPKGGFQKRIDELTKQREEFRREKEEYARRLDETLAILKDRQPASRTETRTESTDDPQPIREQFDSPDEYAEARADWSARQAVRRFEAEQRAKADQERASQEFQQVLTSWHERRAKTIEKYPDYEAVAESSDVQIAQHVGMALMNVPNGPEVAYWLGKNPAEAARISALGPPHAAIEIGRLSERLNTPPPTSKAPAPVKPLASGSNEASKVAPEDDPSYMERRLDELRKRR